MASLPTADSFNAPGVTQAQFRTSLAQLVTYLTGLLGTSGLPADARTALGVGEGGGGGLVGSSTATLVTPSDSAVLSGLAGGLYFEDGGTAALEFSGGVVLVIEFPPRSYFPNRPLKLRATGTDIGTVYGWFA